MVERGAVAAELPPELLLPLGVGERRRIASGPLYLGGVAGAGGRGLGAVSSAPRHHVALAPPHEGPLEDHVWFKDRWMVASMCDE
jgi:hypothetical protein